MAHLSENSKRLQLARLEAAAPEELLSFDAARPDVWFFVLPFASTALCEEVPAAWANTLVDFAERADERTTVAILTTPYAAARLYLALEPHIHFKLWTAVKLAQPMADEKGLKSEHAALLILTRYRESLIHTKTRIAYTYCPFCERTTKDYGGKKHTYHEYGTLMSDVWRDISCDPQDFPHEIATRLADLFGLEPFETLHCVDIRDGMKMLPSVGGGGRSKASKNTSADCAKEAHSLRQGDCLELLADIPSNSIDFCFADPPYNLNKKYENWHDTLEIDTYFRWCDSWLSELARIVRPGCTVAILNIPLWTIRHFAHLEKTLRFQYWIVWEGLSLPVRMIMPAHYAILCFSKGEPRTPPGLLSGEVRARDKEELLGLKESYCLRQSCIQSRRFYEDDRTPISDLWWDIHRLKHNCRRVDHPCQLPPALMRRLIALFTHPGECVLDPFNGVGTTTLAAEQLERRFIGIELSEYYHEIAKRRHAELRAGEDPFRKTKTTPRAKNSRVARLEKQTYAVPKKVLQLDVRRIARLLGKLPTRADVERLSKYPIDYFDNYFISWGEVCAAARTTGMVETKATRKRSPPTRQLTLFAEGE